MGDGMEREKRRAEERAKRKEGIAGKREARKQRRKEGTAGK